MLKNILFPLISFNFLLSQLFFSEYAEGSSYNKYLEIYNAGDSTVDLSNYSLSTCSNGCNDGVSWDYPDNFEIPNGTILASSGVYVICNPQADPLILNQCDDTFNYLSNGDDVMALTDKSTGAILDIIGEIGDDPGNGWDVAGVDEATKDKTLVRKPYILSGNSDWSSSAGTNEENSEWIVMDKDDWSGLGQHSASSGGCTDSMAFNYNSFATEDDGSCVYATLLSISQIQGNGNTTPYQDLPVDTSGIVTGKTNSGFYIQDNVGPWNGIFVYSPDVDGFSNIQVGDDVRVLGYAIEYYDLTEIQGTSITIESSNNTLPDPVSIFTGGMEEAYEGVRVKLDAVTCTVLPNNYNQWIVNDGSGDLYIDDNVYDYSPDLNQVYDLIGIGHHGVTYNVQVTDVSISSLPNYPLANAGEDQSVDYGALVTLDGSGSTTDGGFILGYTWTQISGVSVDLGNYENESVSFTAPNQYAVLTFALEVINNFGNSHTDYVNVEVGSLGLYEIQYATNAGTADECYPSNYVGNDVSVTGIVTAVRVASSKPTFYIQDPNYTEWAGTYIYFQDELDPLSIGDEVSLDGVVEEYFGFTEIKNPQNITLLSTGNSISPIILNTGDIGLTCNSNAEQYEGMFVRFNNVTIESKDEIPVDYDNDGIVDFIDIVYFINDGSGTAKINDYMFDWYDDCGWPEDLVSGDTLGHVEGVIAYSGCSTCESQYVMYPHNRSSFSGLNDCTTSAEICDNGISDDGDPYIDCDDFDCNNDPACGGGGVEICDNGISDDGDPYIDCDDFDCSNDPACGGSGSGSCAEYGCVGYTPSNACQCNDLCVEYGNCCDDYEELCAGDDGGSTDTENCTNGIDDDGDGYIDCEDYNCDGTIGDADPACGGTDGGSTDTENCTNGIDDDGDGYIDCEDYNCDGTIGDADPACGGSSDGGSSECDDSVENLFFSEYAEGTSNHKYLEIYNNSSETVDLCGYAFPNATNGANIEGTFDYWNTFDSGSQIEPGDVFVICHGSADDAIQAECDQNHTYLSNGNDGFCLVYGSESDFEKLDCIGTWSSTDPGDGWEVAGVSNGTKDHTLIRKSSVSQGNEGNWDLSAGTNADDSEWIVLETDDWSNIGSHQSDNSCTVGDINNDGLVNVVDIVGLVSFVLETNNPTSDQECSADLNYDGIINVVDIVAAVAIVLNS